MIIVVVVAVLATKALDLHADGVAIVGDVPTGFEFVSLSSVSANDLIEMLPGALAIVIVGLAQSLAIAKSYATKHHEKVDANREMLGYGAANLGAGVLQGFTVTGGPSASATAERVGAKSPPVAFLVSALMTLLTILFLAGLFTDLPEAVLGAIVIWAVSGMIDPGEAHAVLARAVARVLGGARRPARRAPDRHPARRRDRRRPQLHPADPHDRPPAHRRARAQQRRLALRRPRGRPADATPIPGVLIHRFEAELIFANADLFQDDVLAARSTRPIRGPTRSSSTSRRSATST